MAAWTQLVLRFRWPILGFWLVVLLAGVPSSVARVVRVPSSPLAPSATPAFRPAGK